MRFSMIIFFTDATCWFCHQEVARIGGNATTISDGNKSKAKEHIKQFKSMENTEKSYSEVKSSKIATVSCLIFLLPCSLGVTSHRRISLLTDKSTDLSSHWDCEEGDIAEAIQMKVMLRMLVQIGT